MSVPALHVSNLVKIYKNKHTALTGISFDVQQGDFFALLGPNGAGKSTTISIVTSLTTKTSGSVSVFGHDIDSDLEAAKSCIGLVPQEFNFSVFEKVEDILLNQAGYYGVPRAIAKTRAEHYLKKLGLFEKRHDQARTLSGGMKRRLMIARALIHEPKLLILDEPTAGVDIELRRSMWDFLRELNQQGVTIILTTHYLEEAELLCRHVGIIDRGVLLENTEIQNLLQKLDSETFIFNLTTAYPQQLSLEAISGQWLDASTLEIPAGKNQSLNQIFSELTRLGISVQSMRNKVNRLEEFFVRLVQQHSESSKCK